MQIIEKFQLLPKKKEKSVKVQAIILDCKTSKNSYNGMLLGRKLVDWVSFACNGLNIKKIEFDEKSNVIEFVKSFIDNSYDYTLVLLSKTPLIKQETIQEIIEYSTIKEIELCKLPVGYVIDNICISTKDINVDSLYSQNIDDFFLVENKQQYIFAEEVLQERINNFHMSNGVQIVKPKSVIIEPEVDIADGVVIYSGNVIKGQSVIGKNVILKENNIITNSKVGDNSCLSGSNITDSVISSGVYVSAFCEINNSLIGLDSLIAGNTQIHNYRVNDYSKIKAGSVLGESDVSDNRTGQSR